MHHIYDPLIKNWGGGFREMSGSFREDRDDGDDGDYRDYGDDGDDGDDGDHYP